MRGKVGLAVAALLVAATAAGSWWIFGASSEPPENDAALVETGAKVYAANCAECHGADGAGQPDWRERRPDGKLPAPPLNGDGHTWHHADAQLEAIIAQGIEALAPADYKSDMRGFGDTLSAREIRAVLAYIKQWWPEDARARQRQISERTQASD